jgi:carbon-monoxide dehydrogenase medium subunit
MVIQGKNGPRVEAIDDFIVDSFATSIKEGEMALEARFPVVNNHTSGAYEKIERKVGDFATAAAAVQLEVTEAGVIKDAGIGITAVAHKPLRVAQAEKLLRGEKPTRDLIRAAADEAAKLADPASDARGSADYKKDMARVLVGRGLIKALGRLGIQL